MPKKLGAVRIGYICLYTISAVINTFLAIRMPQVVGGLANTAYLPLLRRLIATVPEYMYMIALLGFAAYQLSLVALLLNQQHYRLGLWGGILFHLGIIPFGSFNLANLLIATPLAWALVRARTAPVPAPKAQNAR